MLETALATVTEQLVEQRVDESLSAHLRLGRDVLDDPPRPGWPWIVHDESAEQHAATPNVVRIFAVDALGRGGRRDLGQGHVEALVDESYAHIAAPGSPSSSATRNSDRWNMCTVSVVARRRRNASVAASSERVHVLPDPRSRCDRDAANITHVTRSRSFSVARRIPMLIWIDLSFGDHVVQDPAHHRRGQTGTRITVPLLPVKTTCDVNGRPLPSRRDVSEGVCAPGSVPPAVSGFRRSRMPVARHSGHDA